MLFSEEQILAQSQDGLITLTTHRIWFDRKTSSQSIMLENITGISKGFYSHYWLFGIGVGVSVLIVGDVNKNTQDLRFAILIPIIVSVLLFFLSRQVVVTILSDKIKMRIPIAKMKEEEIATFIKKIEAAKAKRLQLLNEKATTKE